MAAEYAKLESYGFTGLMNAFDSLRRETRTQLINRAGPVVLRRIIRKEIVRKLSGFPINVDTGDLRNWFKRVKVEWSMRNGKKYAALLMLPPRAELKHHTAKDFEKGYYPTALEYGHGTVPPYSYLRVSVDQTRGLWVDEVNKEARRQVERWLSKHRATKDQ
jgi:hypothetical protein